MATTALTIPTNRRRFLLATGSAAVVGASIAAFDPVFAAIERHKAVEIEYCEASHLTDEVAAQQEGREITAYDETVMDHAAQASKLATNEFLDTVPQSKGGCRAAIAHFATVDSCEEYTLQFLRSLLKSPALTG